MSKYGSGVSMRTVIENEVEDVQLILERSNLSEEDQEKIMDAMKEMAYQWCCANASACAVEKAIKQQYPDLDMMEMVKQIMYNGVYPKTMSETYPY